MDGSGGEPDFLSGVKNVTVPEGRTVILSCSVRNLGSHKVYLSLKREFSVALKSFEVLTYKFVTLPKYKFTMFS